MLREPLLTLDVDSIPKHLRWTPHEYALLAENLRDDPVEYYKEAAAILEALSPLTDSEALVRLLYQDCGYCHGRREIADKSVGVRVGGGYPMIPCPSCGGSGRTLKDGVAERINHNGEPTLVVPMSMLEGGNPE